MTFPWTIAKGRDTTPMLFQLGEYRRVDTTAVPEGTGAACGYCRTDLWLGDEAATTEFAETQLDSDFTR